jgi:hypothetical protein
MKIEPEVKKQITKNVILSLFIYLLPIVLMFLTFLITGDRPWEKKVHKTENVKSTNNKTNSNNGSND